MKELKFFLVDVFTQEKYSGNQLAVFILNEKILPELMQKIASEINFSETTFVYPKPTNQNTFKIRIFTPTAEIPFAGHPALGSAFIIYKHLLNKESKTITLDLPVGKIPVSLPIQKGKLDILWMKQNQPDFSRIISKQEICSVFKLGSSDINPNYPVQEVSTGLPYFIVPLNSLDSIKKAELDLNSYRKFIEKYNPDLNSNSEDIASTAFFMFVPEVEDHNNDFHTRMFDPYYGVPDDSATGSANGCLLAYLIKHQFFGKTILELRVEQGFEMNRPSLIQSRGKQKENGEIEIHVGGEVQSVAEGFWKL